MYTANKTPDAQGKDIERKTQITYVKAIIARTKQLYSENCLMMLVTLFQTHILINLTQLIFL